MQNEKRLIDAYKLEDLLRSNCARYHCKDDVIAAIAQQPTVDAVEVVHGRWVVSGLGYDCCSECRKVYMAGYFTIDGNKPRPNFNYCPQCGAKMDGGNDNA